MLALNFKGAFNYKRKKIKALFLRVTTLKKPHCSTAGGEGLDSSSLAPPLLYCKT